MSDNNLVMSKYNKWVQCADGDLDIVEELKAIQNNPDAIHDAFYRELEFGTGGLRGIIGAGTNRMNIYTVAKATKGLSDYINESRENAKRGVVISYDSRIKSELFSKVAAEVFIANNIPVYIFKDIAPTPTMSYAIRKMNCVAGVMITASHNPSKYNGYKVYGEDGCQITSNAADAILKQINKIDYFSDISRKNFCDGIEAGIIKYVPDEIIEDYIDEILNQTVLNDDEWNKIRQSGVLELPIIYSPLNGTGLKPVEEALCKAGFKNIIFVEEQKQPDGKFPTCPKPNPEVEEAMELGVEYAKKNQSDIFFATDPDCDRIGVVVKAKEQEYKLLSGNETGILLLDYICSRRKEYNTMPESPIAMKTIVTTDMAEKIAKYYGVEIKNVLTGFKYIGEQIGCLETIGKETSFIFGLEESCGYLSGSYVRDKDGVNAAFLVCEMYAYYKSKGVSLYDKLQSIYQKFGYCLNTQHSYDFEGEEGFNRMCALMEYFRGGQMSQLAGKKIIDTIDYKNGIDGLPKSNVLKFVMEDSCGLIIRPSGTEPKLKIYISVISKDIASATEEEKKITESIECSLYKI